MGFMGSKKNQSIRNVHCALWSDIPNQERSSSEASTTGRAELRKSQEETSASFSCNSCSLTSKNCFSFPSMKICMRGIVCLTSGWQVWQQLTSQSRCPPPWCPGTRTGPNAAREPKNPSWLEINGAALKTIWSQQILEGVTSSHCHWKWMTSNKGELKNVEVTISSIWQKLFKRKPPLWTGIVDEVQRWFLVLSGSGFGHLSVSLSVLSFQA